MRDAACSQRDCNSATQSQASQSILDLNIDFQTNVAENNLIQAFSGKPLAQ
jgi:hypothetical protein